MAVILASVLKNYFRNPLRPLLNLFMLSSPNSLEKSSLLPDDQTLVEKILKGDTDQFDILVTRYRNQVYRFILKFTNDPVYAEDLAQDTFIAAFQNLQSFQGNSKFSTWLLGIARNKRTIIRRVVQIFQEEMVQSATGRSSRVQCCHALLSSGVLQFFKMITNFDFLNF